MSAIVQGRAQNWLNAEFRAVAYAALAAGRRVRLMTANGSQAAAGTEVVASAGYTAGGNAVVFDAATAETGTYSGKVINQAVAFINMPDTTAAPVTGVEVSDGTSGAGARIAFGALTANKTTGLGDTLSIPAGQLTVSV